MKHKKTYKHPQVIVVEIASCHYLLAGSPKGGFGGDPEEEEMD